MFSVKVDGDFSSAHNLKGYRGKCESLHGHNWKVEASAALEQLDKAGMVIDFKVLRKALHACLDRLDHKYLNQIPYFKKVNPTSENIARYIYQRLKRCIKNIKSVTVWENDSSCATYEE